MLRTIVLSSLHKVFPQACPEEAFRQFSCLRNEQVSFQIAYRLESGKNHPIFFRVEAECPVRAYAVQYVPVVHGDLGGEGTPAQPGLYPDMLIPKPFNGKLVTVGDGNWNQYVHEAGEKLRLNAANDSWQSVWFSVNEEGNVLEPGTYPITVVFYSGFSGEEISREEISLQVEPCVLQPQKLLYTNWVHLDCLADYYQVELFSERFWEILENYLEVAAREGMNLALLPAFTPALDTPVDTCRMPVQLVDIRLDGGQYAFDFARMKRYIAICKKVGITHLEHTHFFSQWGAKATPAIYATVDGEEKRIFGWDTPACGDAYREFLQAYIPALRVFLRQEGMDGNTMYHISDEPSESMQEDYRKAASIVEPLVEGCILGDALSHYALYEAGVVQTPIVATDNLEDFYGRAPGYWCYYTGGQRNPNMSNRLITTESPLNRILGVQMYHYDVKGFLHWGLNFYYDALSLGVLEPLINPCGYKNFPGASFCLYPARDGSAYNAIRYKVFGEGVRDQRALEQLEEKEGRAFCEELIRKWFGAMSVYRKPESAEQLLAFRAEVNRCLSYDGEKR